MTANPLVLAEREKRLRGHEGPAFSLHGTADAIQMTACDSYGRVFRCTIRRERGVYACTTASTVDELVAFVAPSLGTPLDIHVADAPSRAPVAPEQGALWWPESTKAVLQLLNPGAELTLAAHSAIEEFAWMAVRKLHAGACELPRTALVPGTCSRVFLAPDDLGEDAALRAHIVSNTTVVGERLRRGCGPQLYLEREVDDFGGWVDRATAEAVLGTATLAEWDRRSDQSKAACFGVYTSTYCSDLSAQVGVRALQLTVRRWLRGALGWEAMRRGTEAVTRFTASECSILDAETIMRVTGLDFSPTLLATELSVGRTVEGRGAVYLAAVLQLLVEVLLRTADEECASQRARVISADHIKTAVRRAAEVGVLLADAPPGEVQRPSEPEAPPSEVRRPSEPEADRNEVRAQARLARRGRGDFDMPPETSDFWLPAVAAQDEPEDSGPCCSICLEPGHVVSGHSHAHHAGYLWICPAGGWEHLSCQDCFARHVHARLDEGMSVITCPCGFTDCMHEVPELMVRSVLTNAEGGDGPVHAEYSQAIAALAAPQDEKGRSHPGSGGLKGAVKLRWALLGTRKCPRCKRRIKKAGGCDHMTCLCGHEMCWRCGGDWCKNGRRGHNFDLFPSRSELKYCCNDKKQNVKRLGAVAIGVPMGAAAGTVVLAGCIVYGTGRVLYGLGSLGVKAIRRR